MGDGAVCARRTEGYALSLLVAVVVSRLAQRPYSRRLSALVTAASIRHGQTLRPRGDEQGGGGVRLAISGNR
jgi:hypothetical protein